MTEISSTAADSSKGLAVSAPATPAGDLQLHEFRSRVFRNTRMLRVWLPPGYADSEGERRSYPVLYLNDGQNLFDPATAYIGVDWQAGRTAGRLIREGRIPPLVVVGIDNARKDRAREYVPFHSLHPPVRRPQGKLYPAFLVDEVMPFVRERYRVTRNPEDIGLGGSSLGSVIALFSAMDRPGAFGRLLLESPSLYIANRLLLKSSRTFREWPARIFIGVGTRELGDGTRSRHIVEDVRRLEHILRRAGLNESRLRVQIDEGSTHHEGEWARRFPEALAFLFREPGSGK